MSLDVYMSVAACPHCGAPKRDVCDWNYTYNCTEMVCDAAARALGPGPWAQRMLGGIEGRAGDYAPTLRATLAALEADPARYRAMDPVNGWGSYDGLVTQLRELLAALDRWPDARVRTWR